MARIATAAPPAAALGTRLACYFARRTLARLTGREPARIIEPLQVYAHVPALLHGYGRLEQATARAHRLPWRLQVLAELKTTALIQCEFCIDLSSRIARQSGLTDEHLLALPRYRDSELFTELEKLVMDYAVAMTRTPADVPGALFARLREHLDEAQLVELTHHIALENLRGRFNVAFGIGAAGFSEGLVCVLPETAPPLAKEGW